MDVWLLKELILEELLFGGMLWDDASCAVPALPRHESGAGSAPRFYKQALKRSRSTRGPRSDVAAFSGEVANGRRGASGSIG